MSKSTLFFKPAIYVALAIYIAFTYSVLAMGDRVIAATIPEDHLVEMVGSFALFVTSGLFFYGFTIARKSLDKTWYSLVKQMVYLALSVLFFFGAGE
ncbi:MAG TPA: hypothetical protein VMN99_04780, partial [Anaerolineales bacterium]|nr:hypothetical protein [Anaerolineales bacterium]